MPAVFEFRHTVRPEEIDGPGHANNVAYIAWMQRAAVAHSTAQGWSPARYLDAGHGWVVRSHKIEYHQPAAVGDAILIRTWVATMRKATSLRRYHVFRESDDTLLATAETLWAYVDYTTGQPKRVPPEVAGAFVLAE